MRKFLVGILFCYFLFGAFIPLFAENEEIPSENKIRFFKKKSRKNIPEPPQVQIPMPVVSEEVIRRLMRVKGQNVEKPKVVVIKPITREESYKNRLSDFYKGLFYNTEDYFSKENINDSKEYAELCRMNMIHQIGLNISKFMDLDTFNALVKNVNEKKYQRKFSIINEAVNYFHDIELTDPKKIFEKSKEYFQKMAEKAYSDNNYQLAYTYFTSAMEGEIENPKLKECKEKISKSVFNIQKGSIVLFGKYEQDGNLDNGMEPIEWIVLNKQDNKLTLISKYVLTHRVVHSIEKKFDWPNSDLCTWLNTDFYEKAFSSDEKKRMNKVGTNVFYLDNYKGDYVVIPCFNDLEKLDYYWLKTYAVPSDEMAKEFIDFDGEPFVFDKDEDGNISESDISKYNYNHRGEQHYVLSSNENIKPDTRNVFWPTGFWVNHVGGNMLTQDPEFNRIYYCNYDENAIRHSCAAKFYNGVRPLISIECPDIIIKD